MTAAALAIPTASSAAPAIRQASAGPPEALRSEQILDRATLEAWGVPRPTRLAFDADGALYILDSARRRLVKVSADGILLHEVALSGESTASTVEPGGVLVDARGSVLVLDRAAAAVLAFDKNGAFLTQRPVSPELADEARDPRASLALDAFGRLWLLAPRERDLIRLDASLARDRTGRFLTPEDSLGAPAAVTVVPNGETWVTDGVTGVVHRFRASGALVGRANRRADPADSTGTRATARIVALAVDASGSVYAADPAGQRILVFGEDGSQILERALGGSAHPWHPGTMAWSPRDRLAAADTERGEIQIFTVERGAASGTRGDSSPGPRAP